MLVRRMEPRDVEHVTALCEQFGYPASDEDVRQRFDYLQQLIEHQIFVAEGHDAVIGWLHVHGIHTLSSPPYVEIRGIVVAHQYRRQGVGRLLMTEAELWALENRYEVVRLRSGTQRPESHNFYPKLGYVQTKTQLHYQKALRES
ncbi:GNAT family N-acetyltransferase [Alicyclobacillus sp. ALC3]|uniref:GNAT family N-acetyltransferase n=1 Tax=Alicyclobacillus sp. ALC3 TaxID=2796143 RepID=UPI0023792E63|nr:GNAT family N-acetyltransferase [Alicyclobacillus sp. ALC3]WDL97057.1 GNAT family N-acetyltransferase [Alicyclobacillus sp. ALC3]